VSWLLDVFIAVAIPLAIEAVRARRNEYAQLRRGGV